MEDKKLPEEHGKNWGNEREKRERKGKRKRRTARKGEEMDRRRKKIKRGKYRIVE